MSDMSRLLIYTAADGNYALQAQVLFGSIVKTHTHPVHLIIFGNGWKPKEVKRITGMQTSLATVEVRSIDADKFSAVKLARGFPLATAYNVLAPEYLLQDESRAIYMDADMVVMEDLTDLWELKLSTAVGAVLDAHIVWMASPSMWRPWKEEKVDPMTPYLNTGLMLIDLERWRTENLTGRTLEYLEKYTMPCVDQDALNFALNGAFDQLHPRYNSMPYHLLKMFRYVDAVDPDERIGEAITHPAVVHFHRSFFGKPWTYFSTHPGTKMWRTLASEVHPGWRKQVDVMSVARARAASYAGMTVVDDRTVKYSLTEVKATSDV
jgi:lipopolysaccharide biosynthesis glycosyltransferase